MIRIENEDCYEYIKTLADKSVKAFIFDPPYGVLTGHKIETNIDIPELFSLIDQKVRDDGFIVFFGILPSALQWVHEGMKLWRFTDHIVWAKRTITSPYLPIQRSHESIFILRKTTQAKYIETNAKFEDLKTPAMALGLQELSSVKTVIADLHRRLNDNYYNSLYYQDLPTAGGWESTNDEFYSKYKPNTNKKVKNVKLGGEKKNDDFYKSYTHKLIDTSDMPKKQNTNDTLYGEDRYGSSANMKEVDGISFRYRSKHLINQTTLIAFMEEQNIFEEIMDALLKLMTAGQQRELSDKIAKIWSFLPQNQTKFGANGENWKHPTVKPVALLERLILLCTEEGDLVCDMFMGTGTTALAAFNQNRNCVGCELDEDYMKIAEFRLALAQENKEKTPEQKDLF